MVNELGEPEISQVCIEAVIQEDIAGLAVNVDADMVVIGVVYPVVPICVGLYSEEPIGS